MSSVDQSTVSPTSEPCVIVALDYSDPQLALALARRLDPSICRLKVGKELFTTGGPGVVEQLHGLGFEIFLDLKFHDIPNTCAKAVKASADMGVWMVNVHASGGRKMMEAAKDALVGHSGAVPRLIAVTVLTSFSEADIREVGVQSSPEQQVLHLASLAQQSGLDGVVCSAQEAGTIKQALGQTFTTVTPGIRPLGSASNDQTRITTPQQAVQLGSDYLVIGRPITQAEDPEQACRSIIQSIS